MIIGTQLDSEVFKLVKDTYMETKYEEYTSACGKIIVKLIAGLDKKTVGILLTKALEDFPDTIGMIRHEGSFSVLVNN
jgi:hypothetical protein